MTAFKVNISNEEDFERNKNRLSSIFSSIASPLILAGEDAANIIEKSCESIMVSTHTAEVSKHVNDNYWKERVKYFYCKLCGHWVSVLCSSQCNVDTGMVKIMDINSLFCVYGREID